MACVVMKTSEFQGNSLPTLPCECKGEFLKIALELVGPPWWGIALELVGPPWWGLCAYKETLNGKGIVC